MGEADVRLAEIELKPGGNLAVWTPYRVLIEKLGVVRAVRQVAFVAGVVVQPAKRWRIQRQVNPAVRHGGHNVHAIGAIDGIPIGNNLFLHSHDGTSTFFV